ncbi:hypothetical protein SAMN05443574_107153 [Haloarcula vallismortis]|uniref:Uncharacterized protein n=2 Tax=Haloarcula vallismortis TaxID=28442 RepID=M0JK12_HALVA|nr:hypothetical protein [Haloarcula vallismortis]EMA09472.1 hypothetical protein C437_06260 [Haloarcula vallismortis ATCC 29715]SDW83644.1 hypothetical protein SAMN05443574_107153 [Haloarcula vallismortis]
MDPQRTARQRASERARRVEATVDRTTGGAAYPVRVEELASEYGSADPPAGDLSAGLAGSTEGEFDSPTEVRAAIRQVTAQKRTRTEATFDEREQS